MPLSPTPPGVGVNPLRIGSSEPNPNLLLWSEEFQQAAWAKILTTVTADQTNDPNGTLTADLLDPDSASRSISQDSPQAVTPGGVYTASLYILAGPGHAGGVTRLQIEDGVGSTPANLVAGAAWQRVVVTRTADLGATVLRVRILPDSTSGTAIYAWGAKLEEGGVATAYVKREGT